MSTRQGVELVDAQVHAWDAHSADRPWQIDPSKPPKTFESPMKAERVVVAMDEVGVDAAVLVTPALYGSDNGYQLEAVSRFPGRFAVVGKIFPDASDLSGRLRSWLQQPGMRGLRVTIFGREQEQQWFRGDFTALLMGAERHAIPVYIWMPDLLRELAGVAERHPALQIIVDHMGLKAPPIVPAGPEPFRNVAELARLARYPNVAVRISAVPSLSQERFPFRDIWPHVLRVVSAFGPERVMWGSDFTRCLPLHTYREGLDYVHELPGLSAKDKELLLGRSLRRLLRWPATSPVSTDRA